MSLEVNDNDTGGGVMVVSGDIYKLSYENPIIEKGKTRLFRHTFETFK